MARLNPLVPMVKVIRQDDGSLSLIKRSDAVSAEEPLEIRLNGQSVSSTMRTPGHDLELAHGFLYSEGIIRSAQQISQARYCQGATGPAGQNTYNLLDLTGRASQPGSLAGGPLRLRSGNSACGLCGSTSIEESIRRQLSPISPIRLSPDLILSLPHELRSRQKQFKKTGGIHAAAAFDQDGQHLVTREDIGRHNAADKVIGHLLLAGQLPASGRILVMSSRASFELVQKAVMAGFSALLAVSASSSLAVELAQKTGLTLIAFTREKSFNVYSGELDLSTGAGAKLE